MLILWSSRSYLWRMNEFSRVDNCSWLKWPLHDQPWDDSVPCHGPIDSMHAQGSSKNVLHAAQLTDSACETMHRKRKYMHRKRKTLELSVHRGTTGKIFTLTSLRAISFCASFCLLSADCGACCKPSIWDCSFWFCSTSTKTPANARQETKVEAAAKILGKPEPPFAAVELAVSTSIILKQTDTVVYRVLGREQETIFIKEV